MAAPNSLLHGDAGHLDPISADQSDQRDRQPRTAVLKSIFWTVDATTYLITTRYILVEKNYPTCLVILQLLAAALPAIIRHARDQPSHETWRNMPWSTWIGCTASALSLLLFTQAVLHFSNLSVLAMLCMISWLVHDTLNCPRAKSPAYSWPLIRLVILASCCVLLLYDEYRLTVNGLLFSIPALLLAGLAMFCFGAEASAGRPSKNVLYWSLGICFAIAVPVALMFELGKRSNISIIDIAPLVAVNLLVSTATVSLQGLLHIPCVRQVDRHAEGVITMDTTLGQGLFAGVIGLSVTAFSMPTYVTLGQAMSYLISTIVVAPIESWNALIHAIANARLPKALPASRDELLAFTRSHMVEGQTALLRFTATKHWSEKLYAGLLAITWLLYLQADPTTSISISTSRVDTTYSASTQLDVVISMYDESPDLIRRTMTQLLRIPAIAATRPSLILYTKLEQVDLNELAAATGASEVYHITNQGREGETYLYHILNHWNHLARHTLFIQADVHNERELFPRIEQYFVADTGMLSLGFSGTTCDCESCGDRWGWTDTSGVISKTYAQVYGKDCKDHRLLLSYKGQFIASAARIRGTSRAVYQDLYDSLTQADSWAHEEPYLDHRPDSMNAPLFGFTLERMWSMLMQCDDQRIAALCPTLLSGSRCGGSLSDCQCLDPWTNGMGDITFELEE